MPSQCVSKLVHRWWAQGNRRNKASQSGLPQSGQSSPPVALFPVISPNSHTCVLQDINPSFAHTCCKNAPRHEPHVAAFVSRLISVFFFWTLLRVWFPSLIPLPWNCFSFWLLKIGWQLCGLVWIRFTSTENLPTVRPDKHCSIKFSTNFTSAVCVLRVVLVYICYTKVSAS